MAQQTKATAALPWGWSTRSLVIVAIVSAIFAVVNVGFAFLSRIVEVLGGPLGSFALAGLYQIPYLLAFLVTGLPGAALLAGLIDDIVEVLLGRSRSLVIMVVAGAMANVFGQGLTVVLYGWTALVAANLWWILVAIISGGVFGLVTYGIGRLLWNSGLLRMG